METHERSNDTFLKLAERGIITIYDEINEEMIAHVRDRLAVAQAHQVKELEILIQTGGGSALAGLCIYDMIRAAPVNTRRGLVLGYARSMGVTILQACDVREATRHTQLLIHYATYESMPLQVLRDPKKLKEMLAATEFCQSAVETILAKRTKRKLSDIRKVCALDTEMSSAEALEFGLIDAIRD